MCKSVKIYFPDRVFNKCRLTLKVKSHMRSGPVLLRFVYSSFPSCSPLTFLAPWLQLSVLWHLLVLYVSASLPLLWGWSVLGRGDLKEAGLTDSACICFKVNTLFFQFFNWKINKITDLWNLSQRREKIFKNCSSVKNSSKSEKLFATSSGEEQAGKRQKWKEGCDSPVNR